MSLHNIARLSLEPLKKCMTSKNIKAGFMKSRIHPMDSSKLMAFFESTESTSSLMTSSHIVEDNPDEAMPQQFLKRAVNATTISQEIIAEKTVAHNTMFQDTCSRDEEVTSVQGGMVFSDQGEIMASAQEEMMTSEHHETVISELHEMAERAEQTKPGDEVLTYSFEVLDLSTSSVFRELNDGFHDPLKKIFPTNSFLPLDLTKTESSVSTSIWRVRGNSTSTYPTTPT